MSRRLDSMTETSKERWRWVQRVPGSMEMGHLKENLGFDGKLATMLRTPDLSPPDPEFHWRVLPRIKK